MAYRFRRKESAAAGIARIAREQTAAAVSLLADRGNDVENRVHEARRHLKRIRAVLHLIRPALDPDDFAAENQVLRAAARRLSNTRDADAVLGTLQSLTKDCAESRHKILRRYLEDEAARARRAISATQLGRIAALVRNSGLRVAAISVQEDGWSLLAPGFTRSLRGVKKGAPDFADEVSDATLHQWRRRLKRLLNQLELIRQFLPKAQRKRVKNLTCLVDTLGEHHDVALLEEALRDAGPQIAIREHDSLQALIAARRETLLRRMRKLLKTSFPLHAKAMLERIHRSWKSSRRG